MTIEKLPSGNYRVRQMYKKKFYSIICDHKPTKAEAKELLQEHMIKAGTLTKKNMTVHEAIDAYCNLKSNILSPSTIVGYKKCARQLSQNFSSMGLNDLDQLIVQNEINNLTARLSPKSVRNVNGVIAMVLKTYRNGLQFDINLPQNIRTDSYIPTEADIKAILEAVKDTDYWVCFNLGILGMRRSEICALSPSDLSDDNLLVINKAKIQNEKKEWIIKPYLKTESSRRTILLPAAVADRIRTQGYIFDAHPERLLDHLHTAQRQLGIKSFRFHDLRHYYASMAHAIGIPDKYIQLQGGWKTDHVMKKVYRHALEDECQKNQLQYINRIYNDNSKEK